MKRIVWSVFAVAALACAVNSWAIVYPVLVGGGSGDYAPALGDDDNYVSDSEKSFLGTWEKEFTVVDPDGLPIQDSFSYSKPSSYSFAWMFGPYTEANTSATGISISSNRLLFSAAGNGTGKRVSTRYHTEYVASWEGTPEIDTSTWAGYTMHIDINSVSSINSYTCATFGTVEKDTTGATDNSWSNSGTNLPIDGIWCKVDTSGTKIDISVMLNNVEVINDDDNDISSDYFDIYVLKDAGGDQITVKNGGSTVYSGTIPSSGQLPNTVNLFAGQYASGGTSSDVAFDNLGFYQWDSTEPAWGTSFDLERLSGATAQMIGF